MNILFIEDDPMNRRVVKDMLDVAGATMAEAGLAEEGLARIEYESFDVILMDLRMPGMDGLEVAARIKATQPWLPVVIVTGFGSPESKARAKELGIAGFLHKPLSPEMIEGSARDVLLRQTQDAPAPAATAKLAEPPAPVQLEVAAPGRGGTAKNLALFLAAPFIGLAYAVAFPFIGLVLLARYGYRALRAKAK